MNNFALRYPIEPEHATYTIVPGVVQEPHGVQYEYAFELIAIPFKEELLARDGGSEMFECIFKGAINWSVSPKGNQFEGDYRWLKQKGDYYETRADDIKDVLRNMVFRFLEQTTINPQSFQA